jgi:ANTAR domain-containing protein
MSTGDSVDATLAAERERIWADAREYADHRAIIEQAKGMLMFVYGLDADEAFAALRCQSQQHNVKLRLIAEQVVKDLVELAKNKGPARRLAFDGLMLTAHRRITDVAVRQLAGQSKTGVATNALGRVS